jgi:hypothetical protein
MAALQDLDLTTAENALPGAPPNVQTGTSYTPALTDAGNRVTLSNASPILVTVPTNASVAFQVGTLIWLTQLGAGLVSVAGDTGVTVNALDGTLDMAGQYSSAVLFKEATNTWTFVPIGGGGGGGGTVTPATFEARPTLTTGVPVTTSDVTAATTVYLTPYKGNELALYNGASWQLHTLTEISIAVPATTNTMYDIFVYDSGGLTLEAVAWTNDTTRATALATQDGVLVKTGATGRRYVGSFRTTGVSGQTEDSFLKRLLWSYYNRVDRPFRVFDPTNSWNYTTAAYQMANSPAENRCYMVVGVSEDAVVANLQAMASNTSTSVSVQVAIGLDSTTAFATGCTPGVAIIAVASQLHGLVSQYRGYPGIGYHYLAWLERSQAIGTTTWAGDNNSPTVLASGMTGVLRG